MNRDLGMSSTEVHRWASEILHFWFEEVSAERRFAKDEALDKLIVDRFAGVRNEVKANNAAGWKEDPQTLLAAIILFDQFSRNMYRGTAEAFATDALARDLGRMALERGWDRSMSIVERQFLYMPFMHSENLEDQTLCIRLFEALGDAFILDFAHRHAAQIARFGRFPQRNAALGRSTTPEEAELLKQPSESF